MFLPICRRSDKPKSSSVGEENMKKARKRNKKEKAKKQNLVKAFQE
jgi:hypothetical protein